MEQKKDVMDDEFMIKEVSKKLIETMNKSDAIERHHAS